jgi:DnaJ-class molecular chaperone
MDACSECQGSGLIEVDVVRPQGFGRDVGVIDVEMEVCETCSGDGEVEQLVCGEDE